MTERARAVTARTRIRHEVRTPGFTEGTVFHGNGLDLDPFLAFTDFHMTEPTFGPHPHAGFSAVTYMFTDSLGSFVNRDSLGDRSIIGPGALHWTQAASGMLHEEVPVEPGVACHGLQMFVNLRDAHKTAPPRALHLDAADAPEIRPAEGVRVRVVAGRYGDTHSPLDGLLTPITLLDVHLDQGATLHHEVAPDERAIVMTVAGATDEVGTSELAVLDGPDDLVSITATAPGTNLLLLTGRPIGEPVVMGGPFVMTSRSDIDAAEQRFRRGEMGHLTASY